LRLRCLVLSPFLSSCSRAAPGSSGAGPWRRGRHRRTRSASPSVRQSVDNISWPWPSLFELESRVAMTLSHYLLDRRSCLGKLYRRRIAIGSIMETRSVGLRPSAGVSAGAAGVEPGPHVGNYTVPRPHLKQKAPLAPCQTIVVCELIQSCQALSGLWPGTALTAKRAARLACSLDCVSLGLRVQTLRQSSGRRETRRAVSTDTIPSSNTTQATKKGQSAGEHILALTPRPLRHRGAVGLAAQALFNNLEGNLHRAVRGRQGQKPLER
jgi:hypothetical protein